jgi:hypothetical protein
VWFPDPMDYPSFCGGAFRTKTANRSVVAIDNPGLRAAVERSPWGWGLVTGFLSLSFSLLLSLLLGGCGMLPWDGPPTAVVQRAVALQLLQTQTDLWRELGDSPLAAGRHLDPQMLPDRPVITLDDLAAEPGFRIDRLRIQTQQAVTINDKPGWQLSGIYDWSQAGSQDSHHAQENQGDRSPASRQPQPKAQQHRSQPFSVYLQRQARGQTWRLARPDLTQSTPDRVAWLTYRL